MPNQYSDPHWEVSRKPYVTSHQTGTKIVPKLYHLALQGQESCLRQEQLQPVEPEVVPEVTSPTSQVVSFSWPAQIRSLYKIVVVPRKLSQVPTSQVANLITLL